MTTTHVDGTTVDGTALPLTQQNKIAKTAFTFDVLNNCYACPTGQTLTLESAETHRSGGRVQKRFVYRCKACAGCSFRPACTTDARGRAVRRMEDEPIHERQRQRMKEEKRRADYRLRRCTVEPVLGILKHVQGMRRFLLRGLEGVAAEWSLASAGFNFNKLIRRLKKDDGLRGRFRALVAARIPEGAGMAV